MILKLIFKIFLGVAVGINCQAQVFQMTSKVSHIQHKFPASTGPNIEVGASYKFHKNWRINMSYYTENAKSKEVTTQIIPQRDVLNAFGVTRGSKGIKLGVGYDFSIGKNWSILTGISAMSSNVEIITSDIKFDAFYVANSSLVSVPFPAYYAYLDYYLVGDLNIVRRLKDHHEITLGFAFGQSPWNINLSRFLTVQLGFNVSIFNLKGEK